MRLILWILRILVFIGLFGLAIKNSGSIVLRFFFGHAWEVPLSLVLLVTFVLGAAVGLSVALTTQLLQRRELNRLRRLHEASVNDSDATVSS